MARRKTLVGISILGHVALLTGVFLHDVWDIDRLDYESRTRRSLAVMVPTAAEGGTPDLPKPAEMPRKVATRVVTETRQPRKPDERKLVIESPTPGGTGQTTGPGRDGPPGDTDGPCRPEDGPCAPPPPAVPPLPDPPRAPEAPPQPPVTVTPNIFKGLRTSGETAIHPLREVANQMVRDHNLKTSGSFKVCISAAGAVASVAVIKSTGYSLYDDALATAARRWTYRPYAVNGVPVPVCSVVTFVYEMR